MWITKQKKDDDTKKKTKNRKTENDVALIKLLLWKFNKQKQKTKKLNKNYIN